MRKKREGRRRRNKITKRIITRTWNEIWNYMQIENKTIKRRLIRLRIRIMRKTKETNKDEENWKNENI